MKAQTLGDDEVCKVSLQPNTTQHSHAERNTENERDQQDSPPPPPPHTHTPLSGIGVLTYLVWDWPSGTAVARALRSADGRAVPLHQRQICDDHLRRIDSPTSTHG